MSTLNIISIKNQYQFAIDLRRKALKDVLDVRERLEATLLDTTIDSEHPDLLIASEIFNLASTHVDSLRALLMKDASHVDISTCYSS